MHPASVQEPRGKDMAAFGIGAQLNFIDRKEIDLAIERHRFDRADEIGRVRRQDLFFAGDQRNRACAPQLDDPVVILAGEQPQREPDHAAAMAEHPLDGEMGLAGIGRPEDRDEPRSGAEHGHALKVSGGTAARARANRPKSAVRDAAHPGRGRLGWAPINRCLGRFCSTRHVAGFRGDAKGLRETIGCC